MKIKIKTLGALAAAAVMTACASGPDLSGSGYDASQVRADTRVINATVMQVREVNVTRPSSGNGIGTLLGGAIGAAMGSQVGDGNGKALATLVGGAGGAVVGNELSSRGSVVKGWEIVVRSDAGNVTAITQAADGYPLVAGQRVVVLDRGGVMRVAPAR